MINGTRFRVPFLTGGHRDPPLRFLMSKDRENDAQRTISHPMLYFYTASGAICS